jgi:hypothetical protein
MTPRLLRLRRQPVDPLAHVRGTIGSRTPVPRPIMSARTCSGRPKKSGPVSDSTRRCRPTSPQPPSRSASSSAGGGLAEASLTSTGRASGIFALRPWTDGTAVARHRTAQDRDRAATHKSRLAVCGDLIERKGIGTRQGLRDEVRNVNLAAPHSALGERPAWADFGGRAAVICRSVHHPAAVPVFRTLAAGRDASG